MFTDFSISTIIDSNAQLICHQILQQAPELLKLIHRILGASQHIHLNSPPPANNPSIKKTSLPPAEVDSKSTLKHFLILRILGELKNLGVSRASRSH